MEMYLRWQVGIIALEGTSVRRQELLVQKMTSRLCRVGAEFCDDAFHVLF
uniref:Transposase n=1 Tax=Peronospora matthiolae TaxID=2874970 RepID=A0AAV1TY80_9STRA